MVNKIRESFVYNPKAASLALFLAITGAVILVSSGINEFRYLTILVKGEEAVGLVVDVHTTGGRSSASYPVIEFKVGNEIRRFRSSQAMNTLSGVNVKRGDDVPVIYSVQDASEAEIKRSGFTTYRAGVVFGLLILMLSYKVLTSQGAADFVTWESQKS